ncbi:MAG: hypothetical protein H6707_18815 [Deltaproteobacteria bacterium]|nr:hypothetical protein [Deltaproteobacteria bacterium]
MAKSRRLGQPLLFVMLLAWTACSGTSSGRTDPPAGQRDAGPDQTVVSGVVDGAPSADTTAADNNNGCTKPPPASDQGCRCNWDNANCDAMTCKCDATCGQGGQNCLITPDSSGGGSSQHAVVGKCQSISCQRSDLEIDVTCKATACPVEPDKKEDPPPAVCGPAAECKPGAFRYCDLHGRPEWSKSVCGSDGKWGPCLESPPPQGKDCWDDSYDPELCCRWLGYCCQDGDGSFVDWGKTGACKGGC